MPITIIPLYISRQQQLYIIEIKRTDLAPNAKPEAKFFWLLFENNRLSRLTFKSSNTKGNQNYRIFKEGTLQFDQISGTFLSQLGTTLNLENQSALPLSEEMKAQIINFIANSGENH